MKSFTLATLAALAPAALAQSIKGFNYGSVNTDNSPVTESQFQTLFNDAKNLEGTSGFTAARLFTMIQGGSTNSPTQALQAAVNTQTKLLLGLWGSGGQTGFAAELAALSSAISQYGSQLSGLCLGISVGSEDLYRNSPTGIINKSGVGAQPNDITNYISQLRTAIANTPLSGCPVGHVDTWTAWVNSSNNAVISAVDFIGMDAYPYFQNTFTNPVEDGGDLFFSAYNQTVAASQGKPVWITETGWPVSGPTENQAVASTQNAQSYWDQVACKVLGQINTFWYTLQDAYPTSPSPSFGLIGAAGGTTPLYNLTCPNGSSGSSSASSSSTSKPSSSGYGSVSASSGSASGTPAPKPSGSGSPVPAPQPSGSYKTTVTSQYTAYTTVCPSGTIVTTVPVSGTPQPQSASTGTPAPAPSATPSSSGKSCPATLTNGAYEYPHLIVPVNSASPSQSYGTSYNGTVSSTISSLYNFDIPTSDAGKTCSLVFLLPQQSQLQTSSFTLSGSGGLDVKGLSSPATQGTTYSSCPATTQDFGGPSSVTPGNSYVIASGPCAAGATVGYKVSATGSLALNYFQDYNPSPIGLYITVC